MKVSTILILPASLACFGVLFASSVNAEWKFQNANVRHSGQSESWICGPTTISMWASAIWRVRTNSISYSSPQKTIDLRKQNIPPMDIADSCCRGGNNGDATNIPEFMRGIYDWTPSNPAYIFSEWTYSNDKAAIKGVMWTVARFGEPVAVAGGNGSHYLLVRGGRSEYNPFDYYSSKNPIRGVYVNDATEDSPKYSRPVSGMYKDREYPPATLMGYWTKIGAQWDKKHRSIERYGTSNGKTYSNNDRFENY